MSKGGGGKFIVAGRCLEDDRPLEGCALLIGKEMAYSNHQGEFELHVKKSSTINIAVSLDDFTSPGDYEIISAPVCAKPGDGSITIVVRRRS